MIRLLKPLFILVLILFTPQIIFAQDVEKTVEIVVSGSAKTQDEAKQLALRSAIEQAFGVFISSKTEILNDNLVSDQITSIASGNIKSYQVLNESQLPDGSWGVTLKSIVSIDKLTSFVQSKGVEVEVKGGLFALNIKQQILNEQAEVNAIKNMIVLLHEPLQLSFDYSINIGNPKSLDSENKSWEVPLKVEAVTNKNIDFCANYFMKTLKSISLTESELESYNSLNKEVFKFYFEYQGISNLFYLRKKSSLNLIEEYLGLKWSFYMSLFKVNSGIDEYNGYGYQYTQKNENHELRNNINQKYDLLIRKDLNPYTQIFTSYEINFPSSGQVTGVFSWSEERNLSQIEKISKYDVKPRGVVSQFKNGGIVVHEENGHGLVMSFFNLGEYDWLNAKSICENLELNGFNDWYLPSKDELNYIIQNRNKIGFPSPFWYDPSFWSSTEVIENMEESWCITLGLFLSGVDGDNDDVRLSLEYNNDKYKKDKLLNVIAFRRF